MRYPLISIGLTLAVGIAIGLILQKNSATSSNTPPDIVTDTAIVNSDPAAAADPNADITTDSLKQLHRRLQNEIFARMAFEKKLEELGQKIADLEAQPAEILTLGNLYWFLGGAGVLLVGFLTGFSVKRQRRWF